jgi:hypothetical protein
VTKWIPLLSTLLGLANLVFSNLAFAQATLRTTACSTLSQVSYNGRDYAIRSYAVRHNLEWKNATKNSIFSCTSSFPTRSRHSQPSCVIWCATAKGEDGRELSGSETAEVLGVYGTNPGPGRGPTSRLQLSMEPRMMKAPNG